MRKHLPSALILSALLLVLCLNAFAADDKKKPEATSPAIFVTASSDAAGTSASFLLDGSLKTSTVTVNGTLVSDTSPTLVGNATYVSIEPTVKALFPSASCDITPGCLTISDGGLFLRAQYGFVYFSVNDRYLYVPDTIRCIGDRFLVPVRILAEALGCRTDWNQETAEIALTQIGPVSSASYYNAGDLYWLSRVIYAEAGNQPLDGRIAVGTVVFNRLNSDRFPDTVQGVIFAPGQFSTVSNGTIYQEPDTDSMIAAKLCMEGAREAGDSLYFNVTSMYSWADRSCTFVCTIGGHNFYC